jgi:uncharacterized protein YndB with AHSA1/START domain
MADRTVRLHRVLKAPAERVYRAFLDPDALVKWLPPNGFTGKVDHVQGSIGGTFKMSFANFNGGGGHPFGGKYLELVPGKRLRYTNEYDPGLGGAMETAVSIEEASFWSHLTIVQSNIPVPIPLEACYVGWQQSLELLARLVEAEVPRG